MDEVTFENLTYSVKGRNGREHSILNGVSGHFKHGQLSGILGTSGAGKSTLLNAVSGWRNSGVHGSIHMNNSNSCYITQESEHHSLLTIEELMIFSCKLKIVSRDHKPLLKDVLENLNLWHRKDVTADKLSGGERKRLSIALELVTNPTIFFLDEPTTGLDEVTAVQTVQQLKKLAIQNRIVVCTIHQPSSRMVEMFDHIYIMSKGVCVYQGAPCGIIPFLHSINIHCSIAYNPVDFIVELCESQESVQMLSHAFQNGKLNYESTSSDKEQLKPIVRKFSGKVKQLNNNVQHESSIIHQFVILLQMMMVKTLRNRIVIYLLLIHYLVCGTFIGLIFFQRANDGSRTFDHIKLCWGIVICAVYTQYMIPILAYPFEVKLVKKEHFNRWYGLVPYYFASVLTRIPLQVCFTILYSALIYFLSGLPPEVSRFIYFTLVSFICGFVAESIGLTVGATFNATNGSVVGPMFGLILIALGIYGIDFIQTIPPALNFILNLSLVRHGVLSMLLAQFGYSRQKLDCPEIYCHFDEPSVLLRWLGLENNSLGREFLYLGAIMLFFRVLVFVSLNRRLST